MQREYLAKASNSSNSLNNQEKTSFESRLFLQSRENEFQICDSLIIERKRVSNQDYIYNREKTSFNLRYWGGRKVS